MQFQNTIVLKWALISFLFIILGHLIAVSSIINLDAKPIFGTFLFYDLFFFEHEKNITALFSGFILLLSGAYSWFIGKQKQVGDSKYWLFLGAVFVFLGFDEWFAIHDQITFHYGLSKIGVPVWVLIYGGGALLMGLYYIPFLLKLPKKISLCLLTSGVVYIAGAAIVETFNFGKFSTSNLGFHLRLIGEDGLEILGVILFLWTCIFYLKQFDITSIKLHKRIVSWVVGVGGLDFFVTYLIRAGIL